MPAKSKFSVTRKLQFGISILVVLSLVGSVVGFYSQKKIETSYLEFKKLNETNALLNAFSTLMTNNTLGYMDAIVDKDSGTVDDEIVQKHEEFKQWVDKNKSKISEDLTYLDPKTDSAKFFQDTDLYWTSGRDMIGEIKQKKVDNLGQYDDVIDGKNEELKNLIIQKLHIGEQRFQAAAANLESAQNLNHYVSLISLIAMLGFGALISYLLIRNIKATLEFFGKDLTNGSTTVLNSSVEFSSLGNVIPQSSIKQASALQQTSSAIEEIAARAGEHGKGFAVVAEEVGNLAQMSGNAAQEINQQH